MTNLLATIVACIVTNVTPWNNGHSGCPYWQGGCLVMGCDHTQPEPATERTETTEVVEVKRLSFTWSGETYTAKRERVLSRSVKRWRKRDVWEAE